MRADRHLLPGLLPPGHIDRGIGIGQIVGRVVEPRDAANFASLGHWLGLDQLVGILPVEVESRHVQQDLGPAVRIDGLELKGLAPQMHVRRHREQQRVLVEFVHRLDDVVVRPRRNDEVRVDRRDDVDFLLHLAGVGKDDSHLAQIALRTAVGRVMRLDHQLRAGRNPPASGRRINCRRHAGAVAGDHVHQRLARST